MSDRPAYHCGAEDCCLGANYPECMGGPADPPAVVTYFNGLPIEELRAELRKRREASRRPSHYEDDATGQHACPHTD